MPGPTQGDRVPEYDADWSCTPLLFRLDIPEQANAWESFCATYPDVKYDDHLETQVCELMGILDPPAKLTDAGRLERALAHIVAQGGADGYGTWVFYPWLQRAVKVLPESEFVRVRTNRNLYKITPAEQEELGKKVIGVIGMSVGKSIARVLTTERTCGEIRIADFDRLDLSNMNRIQTSLVNLGLPKTTIVAREIAEQDPYIKVKVFPQGVTKETMESFLLEGGKLDLLLDECDSIDVKIQCRLAARKHRIPVIMETNDRGMIDIERFDLEPDRELFHGLLGGVDPSEVSGLKSSEEKAPYVARILELPLTSVDLKMSMLEVGSSLESWPQLASEIAEGSGRVVAIVRKSLLDSGAYPSQRLRETVEKETKAHDTSGGEAERVLNVRVHDQFPYQVDIGKMIEAANSAASGGNSQPWEIEFTQMGEISVSRSIDSVEEEFLDVGLEGTILALSSVVECLVEECSVQGYSTAVELDGGFGQNHRHFGTVRINDQDLKHSGPSKERRWEVRKTNRRRGKSTGTPNYDAGYKAASDVFDCLGLANAKLYTPDQFASIKETLVELERLRMINVEAALDIRRELVSDPNSPIGISIDSLHLRQSERLGMSVYLDEKVFKKLSQEPNVSGLKLTESFEEQLSDSLGFVYFSSRSRDIEDLVEVSREVHRAWAELNFHGVQVQPCSAGFFVAKRFEQQGDASFISGLEEQFANLDSPFGGVPFFAFRLHMNDLCSFPSKRRGYKVNRLSNDD